MQEAGYTDANGGAADGSGWGYDQAEAAEPQAAAVQEIAVTGQFIPTTGQTHGGGPMRQGRGGSRFNPMGGRRMGPVGDGAPASAAAAEKNELGYIIFAYNIGYQTQEDGMYQLFGAYGAVSKVNVIQDFARGQGKGYGFVTMPNAEEAEAAVNGLNGADYEGNTLQIRFKSPKGQGPAMKMGTRGRGRGGFVSRGGGFGQRGDFGQRGGARGRGGMRGGRGGRGGGGYAPDYQVAASAYNTGYEQQAYAGYDPTAAVGYAAGYADPYAAVADPYATGYSGQGYATYGAASGAWQ